MGGEQRVSHRTCHTLVRIIAPVRAGCHRERLVHMRKHMTSVNVVVPLLIILLFAILGLVVMLQPQSATASIDPPQAASVAPEFGPGDVLHIIVQEHERPDPDTKTGPSHLDRAALWPTTRIVETWALIGDSGNVVAVETHTRNVAGILIQQTSIDNEGLMTLTNIPANRTTSVHVEQMPTAAEILHRGPEFNEFVATGTPHAMHKVTVYGQPAIVVEFVAPPNPEYLRFIREEEVSGGPFLKDLDIEQFGRRIVYHQISGALLSDTSFAITGSDSEHVLTSREWMTVETLTPLQVPDEVFSNSMLPVSKSFMGVRTVELLESEATDKLPFTPFFLNHKELGRFDSLTVTYTTGDRIDLSEVSVHYRGPMFAVARGTAAQLTYSNSNETLLLVQAPVDELAISIQESLPFWTHAEPISLSVDQWEVDGWYLTSESIVIESHESDESSAQTVTTTWVYLPSVDGTGILLAGQGKAKDEMIAIASSLQASAR
jgi:hypothetical protein